MTSRLLYYKLDDDHRAVPASQAEMVELFNDSERRRVAETTVGDRWVSTVFLVIDHGFGGEPQLFETMVFGDGDGTDQWRYATWDHAVAGHERVVAALREGREP